MDVSTMRGREPFDDVLAATLAAFWTRKLGRPTVVVTGEASGQRWCYQPIHSAFHTYGVGTAARRFMRDAIRFTPIRRRMLPQYALASTLQLRGALVLVGRPGFSVDPPVPGDDGLVVLPGNQRVRVFDFRSRMCHVLLKAGFQAHTMRTEIAVRQQQRARGRPWMLPIVEADPDGRWFSEPIVDGFALVRCPPWWPLRQLTQTALTCLDAWLQETRRSVDAASWAAATMQALVGHLERIEAQWPDLRLAELHETLPALVAIAGEPDTVEVAEGHGDLQPGNVIVHKGSREVLLIDWEHAAERSLGYDRLVLACRTRAGGNLAGRLAALLEGVPTRWAPAYRSSAARRSAVALFVLEDLAFFAAECLTGPFTAPSAGFLGYVSSLCEPGSPLRAWLAAGGH